jgi:hypothetical protein
VPTFRLWASLPRFSAECPRVRVPSSVPSFVTLLRVLAIPRLPFKQDAAGSIPVSVTMGA